MANSDSLKEIKARNQKLEEEKLRGKCNDLAIERVGSEEELKQLSNKYKGLWYLAVTDDEGNIEKMAFMKPIDRNILNYASTKITDEGLYSFLEVCMRECMIQVDGKQLSDEVILTEDEYFIPASNSFNKIIEGKKVTLLKR